MKNIILISLISIVMFSCGNKSSETKSVEISDTIDPINKKLYDKIIARFMDTTKQNNVLNDTTNYKK